MAYNITIAKDAASGLLEIITDKPGQKPYRSLALRSFLEIGIDSSGASVIIVFDRGPLIIYPATDNLSITSTDNSNVASTQVLNAGTKTAQELYAILKASNAFYPL